MVSIGQNAPDFTLPDALHKEHSLKGFKGKWVVLYFYPKDNTPGCTTEANQFTALSPQFENENTIVLGISKDSCESHAKFLEKHQIKVLLLSDKDGNVSEIYGAWQEKNLYGIKHMGIVRMTYLIDPDGKVVKVYPKVKANGHAQDVLDSIKELKAV